MLGQETQQTIVSTFRVCKTFIASDVTQHSSLGYMLIPTQTTDRTLCFSKQWRTAHARLLSS